MNEELEGLIEDKQAEIRYKKQELEDLRSGSHELLKAYVQAKDDYDVNSQNQMKAARDLNKLEQELKDLEDERN